MAVICPYLLFGHTGTAAGGMNDYQSAWFSQDEAQSEAQRLALSDWQIAVYQNDALQLVAASSEPLPAEALPGGVSGG